MSVQRPAEPVLAFLRDVAAELEAAGALPGQDFSVHWVTEDSSGEDHRLRPTGTGFEVLFSDRGQDRVLLRTPDAGQARAFFRARVLAAARARTRPGRA